MEIKAALLKGKGGEFQLENLSLEAPKAKEIIVKIVATGICHTDITMQQIGIIPTPTILGHEGAGIVEEIGSDVTTVNKGDHVALSFGSCGECKQCKNGHPSYCEQFIAFNISGKRIDGSCPYHQNKNNVYGLFFSQSSFATYSLATERNVVKVPKDVPLEILGPLGCGIQTGAGTVLNILKPEKESSLIVFGAGTVGLAAVMAAKIEQCAVIVVVDINNERLALGKELGATHIINSSEVASLPEKLKEIATKGFDFAIDTTGIPEVIQIAFNALAVRGHCVTLGVPKPGIKLELDLSVMASGKTISGVIEGDSDPQTFIPQMIELYKQGLFPFDKLISFYSFEDINVAIADAASGKTIKQVLRIL